VRGDSGFSHKRQMSVAELPKQQQTGAMRAAAEAADRFPQIIIRDCGLHVCEIGGEWQVWLNTDDATFTGLCVAVGDTRDEAVAEALLTLEAALDKLQGPAW